MPLLITLTHLTIITPKSMKLKYFLQLFMKKHRQMAVLRCLFNLVKFSQKLIKTPLNESDICFRFWFEKLDRTHDHIPVKQESHGFGFSINPKLYGRMTIKGTTVTGRRKLKFLTSITKVLHPIIAIFKIFSTGTKMC